MSNVCAMHERERGGVLIEDGSGGCDGGRASPVTVREAVVAREAGASRVAPVAPRAAPVALGAALVASTANRGDGGGVGREIWGASGGRGGNSFLVKSKLAVARFAERAIAKVAIAVLAKRSTAIGMQFPSIFLFPSVFL